MRARLEKLGFEAQASELLIKRVVDRAGKHRIYVNGELATLVDSPKSLRRPRGSLRSTRAPILDPPATQLDLLDRYGIADRANAKPSSLNLRQDARARARARRRSPRRKQSAPAASTSSSSRSTSFKAPTSCRVKTKSSMQEKLLLQSSETRVQSADSVRQLLGVRRGRRAQRATRGSVRTSPATPTGPQGDARFWKA